EKYLVRCVPYKTVFDVYVDGDLVEHVGRDDSDGLDTEYDIKIAGKRCQLTLYGGELDLCVDGVLLGAEREMKRREIRNRILLVLGGLAASMASSWAVLMWYIYETIGDPIFGGVTTLIFLMLFGLGGLLMIFFGLKPKKRY
ncbi:MAG: hypothetical protein IKY17_07785, partial [Oscillospiraceae bacterium]|nr:hypothetical protein [Oscillospiraceae bacterium]